MSSYEVGAVLWIIHTDRPGLMAYRVVEEITKKTLEGEQVQYLVQAATPKSKTVRLETIKGAIFKESEEAKMKLIENATKAIDGMVVKIQSLVDKNFNGTKEEPEAKVSKTFPAPRSSHTLKEGYQWMDLEDGTRVQVKIPEIMK
jgi:hypothetical protein